MAKVTVRLPNTALSAALTETDMSSSAAERAIIYSVKINITYYSRSY